MNSNLEQKVFIGLALFLGSALIGKALGIGLAQLMRKFAQRLEIPQLSKTNAVRKFIS